MPGRDIRAAAAMQHAVNLLAGSHPHPNPRVACLILDSDGVIVSVGVHQGAGRQHAEVVALQACDTLPPDATLVVTLEPCAHHGRTPPCVDAIVSSGIRQVVVGALDPDQRVAGAGIEQLRAAGIHVDTGVMAHEVEAADPGYFHHRRTGLPYVTLKLASTLDGSAAAADGTSQWITAEDARADAHLVRARSDAVVVGAGTLRSDDPRLDVRTPGYTGHQPIPVVLAGSTDLPIDRALWSRKPLVYSTRPIDIPSGEVAIVSGTDRVEIDAVLKDLGSRGVIDVLVEGGPAVAGAFIAGDHVDRVIWYLGAKVGAGRGISAIAGTFATLDDAIDIEITATTQLGPDVRIDARVRGH